MWIMPERIPDHVAEPRWPLSWWGQRRGTSHWGGTDPLHLLLLSHHAPLSSCSGSLPLMLLHAQRPVIHAVYYTLSERRGPATISHQLSVPAPSSSHHHSTAASWWRLKPETKVQTPNTGSQCMKTDLQNHSKLTTLHFFYILFCNFIPNCIRLA